MDRLGQRSMPDISPADEARGDSHHERCEPAGYRGPDDDFFCLRFGVWYPSFDCAVRTRFDTCPACRRCEQGRFNLKRHRAGVARLGRRLRCS